MQIIPDPMFALVMTIPFALTFLMLNFLLFRPVREYLEGRDEATVGARHEAKALREQALAKTADLEARLTVAKESVGAKRTAARKAALGEEQAIIDTARKAAEAELATALADISAQATEARETLRGTATQLSTDIATQVLGRAVEA